MTRRHPTAPTAILVALLLGAGIALATSNASATGEDRGLTGGRFELSLSGAPIGWVRAIEPAEKPQQAAPPATLLIASSEITPAFVSLVDGYVQGHAVKKDVRLASGAVVRKANEARLATVKLPGMGGGGAADVELAFEVRSITTQPLLSLAKNGTATPAGARITAFRVDVSGVTGTAATKLDAITLVQKDGATGVTGEIAFEVAAGGGPPFAAWLKAHNAGAADRARAVRLEYVGAEGRAILKVQLDRCSPLSVKAMGASAATRITLACTGIRPG